VRSSSLIVPLLVIAVACSDDEGPTDNNGNPPPTGDVTVANNTFTPATFTATVGETVTWAWAAGAVTHNVTFDDGESSPNQSSGTYSRTFNAAGTYPYHCTIHAPSMSGVVNVGASGGTGGSGGGGGAGYDYGRAAHH
jgi:plastocyanin